MSARSSLHRLVTRVVAATCIVAGVACNLVVSLDDLQFEDTDCVEPCDDRDPCTQHDCVVAGKCVGQPAPERSACVLTDVDGVCLAGKCQATCATDAACDDGNPCTVDVCDAATLMCTHTKVDGAPDPSLPQVQGDCHLRICVGGVDTDLVNDEDVPASNNPCVWHLCTDGVPSTPLRPNYPCGMSGQKCNDMGMCGCTTNDDCTPPDTCGGGDPGTPGTCGCTKTTCDALGKTCGYLLEQDGCGGPLDCNDLTTNYNETDVDCGGDSSRCSTRCPQGKKCVLDTDCATGLSCADGVCCNEPCEGACRACNLPGKVGKCTMIAVDQTDPSCKGTRRCDGKGQCKHADGQPCTLHAQCVHSCKNGVCQ